ncbi:LacI family transcriptional regulator, partial [Enterococcus faecalis]
GVIEPDITNPFFAEYIRGIESVLYKENFILILCNADQDVTRVHEFLTELILSSVDGFVFASSEISNQTINVTLRRLIN